MDKAIKDQVNYLKNILCEEAREYLKKNPLVAINVDGKFKFISKEQDLYRQHTHEYVIQLYRTALCLPYKQFTYEKFSLKNLKLVKPKSL